MRRKLLTSLVSICIIAVGLLAMNIGLGYRPALGLDLRGGISVTLLPAGQSGKDWTQASLDLAVERIRERVDSYGVGEPEILRQDNAIVVNLPGVNDQKKALELVTVTGKVYLRPVLQCVADTSAATTSSSTSTSTVGTATTVAGASTTSNAATTTSGASANTATANTATVGTGAGGPSRRTSTTAPPGTGTPTTSASTAVATTTAGATPTTSGATGQSTPTTAVDQSTTTTDNLPVSDPTKTEVLKTFDKKNPEICQVGPSGGDGTVFEKDSAQAQIIGGGWGVTVTLKDGAAGTGVWNTLAAECYAGNSSCPSRRLAIELDGVIQSAPSVNAAQFSGDVQITGSFSKGEASNLAQVLNSGALPITLKSQSVQSVSATLGKDSLRAALIAGAIGVALVILFMIFYYRRLAIVVVFGLAISGALVYSATSLISRFYNGVLSLSGIAGLIVSIGVTVDSYVVFFERLKDEVRGGRSLRNSAQRGFKAAFKTILVADAVSLIGAAVLWYLSVGAVRGFAFYLGLSTVMDIFVAYFFTRPAVLLLSRSRYMGGSIIFGLETEPSSATKEVLA